jgi:hypothetical protein
MKVNFENILSTLVLLVSFGATIYLGYKAMPTEMGLMIVSGAVFLSFLNIDKFKSFKGAGFSAEMKGTLDKAVATKNEIEELSVKLDEQLNKISKEVENTSLLAMSGARKS